MKISRVAATSAIVICLITTSTYAANLKGSDKGISGNRSTASAKFDKTGGRGMHGGKIGSEGTRINPMSNLVTAGTITQAQADAIQTAMKTGMESKKTMKEILDTIVTAGTIRQAQEDAIIKAIPEHESKGGPQGNRMNPMESLVTAGTITQAQVDAINEAMKSGRESKKTLKETLDTLLTAGTITQAQEDAIIKTMPENGARGGFEGKRVNPIDSLITAGTLTQAQTDAIQAAIKAGIESKKTMKETLDSLVTAGTITKVQEDAIQQGMKAHMGSRR